MNTSNNIFWHEWLELKRNRLQLLILLVFVAASLYAIHYGNAEIKKQQQTINYIKQQNSKEQSDFVKGIEADTLIAAGKTAYENAAYPSKARFFLNYYPINEPSAFSKLSIGQRDIYPYYLQLNAQNLYLQLFKSEISNPKKLLAGNFDLAFVIIYLLPLLIIAFTYNLLSAEKEQATLAMLKTQPVSIRAIMLNKLLFYFLLITALVMVVSIIGFICSSIGFRFYASILQWLIAAILYVAVWFALILLINSFNKNSAFNAIWSVGLWLLFLIIIPSVLNLVIIDEKQVNANTITNAMRRRQGMDETPAGMRSVVNRFLTYFPKYRNPDTSKNEFLEFKAYSAYVTMLDIADKPKVDNYFGSIRKRNRAIAAFNIINPAVNTQNIFNTISRTGYESADDFRNSIANFHQQICRFCFTPLFAERMMTKEDYEHIPAFKMNYEGRALPELLKGFAWLALLTVVLLFISNYKLRKI